jgi:hypothetical protein
VTPRQEQRAEIFRERHFAARTAFAIHDDNLRLANVLAT